MFINQAIFTLDNHGKEDWLLERKQKSREEYYYEIYGECNYINSTFTKLSLGFPHFFSRIIKTQVKSDIFYKYKFIIIVKW